MFGLLQSKFHELWSLRKGSDLQDRPRYTHTSTFATFPFPTGMTPDLPLAEAESHESAAAITAAARELDRLRMAWLWPQGAWIEDHEIDPSFPPRRVPADDMAAVMLRSRTMTALYNKRPEWLNLAHKNLDTAVAAAYGISPAASDDEILARLLELNQERA